MRLSGLTLALLLAATVLAGCGSKGGSNGTPTADRPTLAADKGAITGVVIDDRYRPVPGALVLLTPGGLTATADSLGQFSFAPLEPGAFVLRVQADGHEAAPHNADVRAGEYTEAELVARRIFSDAGAIITTEYSVFIPCAIDFVANGYVLDCTGDQSGDSWRPGFRTDYTKHGSNVTYLVTEVLFNQKDRYEIQVRCDSGRHGGEYYATARIDDTYTKMTMPLGNVTPDATVPAEYGGSVAWANQCPDLLTIVFSDSIGREEIQGLGIPVCCGAGAHFGIKAKFVQSLFIGKPTVDIPTYATLKPG